MPDDGGAVGVIGRAASPNATHTRRDESRSGEREITTVIFRIGVEWPHYCCFSFEATSAELSNANGRSMLAAASLNQDWRRQRQTFEAIMQPHDMKGVFNVWGSCCDDRRDEVVRPVFMPGDFRCNGGLSQPFVISFEMMPRDPVIELNHLTEAADYRLVCIGMRKNGCNAIRRIVECRKRKNGGSIVSASVRAYERKSGRFLGAPDALTERAPLPNIRGRSRG